MTVHAVFQLICDGCDAAYPADVRVVGSSDAITSAARRDGWRVRVRRGEREDHCPECQEAIA